jgi:hypothetical protein
MEGYFERNEYPIPRNMRRESEMTKYMAYCFVRTLNKKAYCIAVTHLGDTYHLTQSNGYLDWNKQNQKRITKIQKVYRGYNVRRQIKSSFSALNI